MHPNSLRKQYQQGVQTVTVARGRSGYGFTISGQNPCRLGGIVPGSSADRAGLQVGDQVLSIDGHDVSNSTHDDVVRRIGLSRGTLALDIAERCSDCSSEDDADSSDFDFEYVTKSAKNVISERVRSSPVQDCGVLGDPSSAWQKINSTSKYSRYRGRSGAIIEHIFGPPQETEENCTNSGYKTRVIDSHKFDHYHFGPKQSDSDFGVRHTKHTVVTRQDRLGGNKLKSSDELINHQLSSDDDSHDYLDESVMDCNDIQVVVSYSGSVEMPRDAPRLAGSRLQSIRAAVQRIRAQRNNRSLVLMDIDADGIRLMDTSRCNVANYVTECIAFCGICPDDRRFFGIVMTPAGKENDKHASSGSSCHVFMVEPELSEHRMHATTAARFGINCTMDLDTDCCLEFPKSATPIIAFLGRLYRQRKSVNGFFAPVTSVLNDIKSNNVCNGSENSKACVVDVANPRRGVVSTDQSFIHDLSMIQPTIHDDDKEDIMELYEDRRFSERPSKTTRHLMSSAAATIVPSNQDRLNPRALLNTRTGPMGFVRNKALIDDVNSAENLRRSLRKFMSADHHQALQKQAPYSEIKSCRSAEKYDKKGPVSSPGMPPPPLPPRQALSRSDSDRSSISSGNLQTQIMQCVPKRTPFMAHKTEVVSSVAIENQIDSAQACSSSKPPLPERRSNIPKPAQKGFPPVQKREAVSRPKSTPPVNLKNDSPVSVSMESTNYDSDPGEHIGQKTSLSKAEYDSTSDSTASALSTVGISAVSCKALTNVGTDKSTVGRAASWAIHFDRLMSDNEGVETFSEFLQKEFSRENLAFYLKCEEYKMIPTADQRKILGVEIVGKHIKDLCCEPVNIDGVVRDAVIQNIASAAPDLFEAAHKQIYLLMKQDSYPRFLKSDIYKQAVIAEMEGKPFPCSKNSTKQGSKLMKKSKSAADNVSEEKRRKSLLPWNRNKTDKKLAKLAAVSDKRNQVSSTVFNSNECANVEFSNVLLNDDETELRVVLPDNIIRTVFGCPGQTLREVLLPLAEKLPASLDFYDIVLTGSEKSVSLNTEATSVDSREIRLEHCVVFRLDLPGYRQTMAIRTRSCKRLHDVIEPILLKHGIAIIDVIIHIVGTGVILGEDMIVSSLDGKHLLVQCLDEVKGKKKKDGSGSAAGGKSVPNMSRQKSSSSLSAPVTIAQHLKSLFGGHSDAKYNYNDANFDELGVWSPDKVSEVKMKSEEGRHSGLFSFMRRSSLGDKGKGNIATHQTAMSSASSMVSIGPSIQSHNQNTDEHKLFDLLKRIQNRQYDDQRGTSLTAFKEMPEFLRISNDTECYEKSLCDKLADEKEILHQSEIEVCRRDLGNCDEDDLQFSLTPSRVLHATCPFEDEFDSVMPSYDNAEQYFSNSVRVSSPDFNDSKLMECSLRDIGMDSPIRTDASNPRRRSGAASGWSLIGNIANNHPQNRDDPIEADFFVVPSVPPPVGRHLNATNELTTLCQDANSNDCTNSNAVVKTRLGQLSVLSDPQHLDSSGSTPSPTTHDLVFINGECIVSKSVPYADDDLEHVEDVDEVFGVV